MSHQTKDKGDFALAYVLADLRAHGIISCLPLSEHLPFDLVALMPDLQTLIRLQVKYRTNNENDAIALSFRSNYYDSKKIYNKPVDLSNIDAYALYSAVHEAPIYFRVAEIPEGAKAIKFRFNPSKNNQQAGIRMAQDYRNPMRLSPYELNFEPLKEQRTVSAMDEIAIAKAILHLQSQNLYILIPQSQYAPFDLLAISSDFKQHHRYRISHDALEYSPFADVFLRYDPSTESFYDYSLLLAKAYS